MLARYRDNMPSHFKFKEYCPVVFRNLRERFEIDEDVYLVRIAYSDSLRCCSSGFVPSLETLGI